MKQLLSKMQAKMLHYHKLSLPLKKPSTLQENSQVSPSIPAHLEEQLYTARVTCHSTKKCSNDCAWQNPTHVQCTCTWEEWWSVGGPFITPEQQIQLWCFHSKVYRKVYLCSLCHTSEAARTHHEKHCQHLLTIHAHRVTHKCHEESVYLTAVL